MADVIEMRALTRYYGKRRGVIDLDLDVHENEVFGFLGPNGAGKTTTIRMLLGFIRPSSGRASIFGLDAWRDAPVVHQRVAHLSGEPTYLGEMTAGHLLDYLGTLRGLPARTWRPLAERLDLDPTVPIKKLSRGNRQKVGVVQVFMGGEPLLVMDEPTTGLDPLMQREFLALIGEARAAGRTVFLSSHNLPEVERTCDRIGIIREGRLGRDHHRPGSPRLPLAVDQPGPQRDATAARLLGDGERAHRLVRRRRRAPHGPG